MIYDILQQIEKDFCDRTQWESFLELVKNKDDIEEAWMLVMKPEMNQCFAIDNTVDKWSYVSNGTWDYRWYLSEFTQESFCLTFNSKSLHLWANPKLFNISEITRLLLKKKYNPILSCFDRIDEVNNADNQYKIVEHGNFIFGDVCDGNYERDQLAWYARFKTKEFVNQIQKKIEKFRKNNEVTNLLMEINKACKY